MRPQDPGEQQPGACHGAIDPAWPPTSGSLWVMVDGLMPRHGGIGRVVSAAGAVPGRNLTDFVGLAQPTPALRPAPAATIEETLLLMAWFREQPEALRRTTTLESWVA